MPLPGAPCFTDRTASGHSEASVRTNLGKDPSYLSQAQSFHHHPSQSSRPDYAQISGHGPAQGTGTDDETQASPPERRSPQLTRYLDDDQRHERIALGFLSNKQGEKEELSVQGSSAESDAVKGLDRVR